MHTSPFGESRGREVYLDLVRQNPGAFFSPPIENLDVLDCGDRFAVRYLVDENLACDCVNVGAGRMANSLFLWITHLLTILVFAIALLAEETWLSEQYGQDYN